MKCNPLRWLWGVIPIAVLSWVAALAIKGGVERDLSSRVSSALAGSNISWAKLNFDGRDLVIGGKADDEEEPGVAVKVANAIYGVRVADVNAELLQKISPYTWGASFKDNKVVLSGHVPNEKNRKAVLASVKSAFPRTEIEDKMELARGNPALPEWQGAVTFALKQLAMLKSGKADLSDLTISVDGEAKNTAAYRDVKTALSSGLKGLKLGADKVTAPVVQPYAWSAKLAANQVVMAGYVPDDKVRADLIAAAQKAFGKAPVDRMEVGAGAPKDWPKAAVVALDQLATLQEGAAELKGTELSLSGIAPDEAIADATRKAFKSKVPGSLQTVEAIKAARPALPVVQPYTTMIEAADKSVDVTGYVPSEAARDAVISAVKAKFPGRNVTDKLQLATGEPAGYDTCLLAGVSGLNRLGTGRVALTGKTVELVGVTEDEALAMALPGEVRAAARGSCETKVLVRYDDTKKRQAAEEAASRAKLEAEAAEKARHEADAKAKAQAAAAVQQVKQAAASACERELRSTAATGSIQFERASDVLLPSSRPVLRKLVEVAKACESAAIEVEGHTDSEGVPERNQPLSERRAQSVVNFLVAAGVPVERINAIGYGDTKPVADNETAEGRSKNRRIEFTVKAK